MARLFRARYTQAGRDGKRVTRTARKWYVEYVDADGIVCRRAGFSDKAATQQLAAELERNAERRKRPLKEHLADYRTHPIDRGSSKSYVDTWGSACSKGIVSVRYGPLAGYIRIQVAGVRTSIVRVREKSSDLQLLPASGQGILSVDGPRQAGG